jgi:hypothetical protein
MMAGGRHRLKRADRVLGWWDWYRAITCSGADSSLEKTAKDLVVNCLSASKGMRVSAMKESRLYGSKDLVSSLYYCLVLLPLLILSDIWRRRSLCGELLDLGN